jgi:hypothetical protein
MFTFVLFPYVVIMGLLITSIILVILMLLLVECFIVLSS